MSSSHHETECPVNLIKSLRNVALAALLLSAGVANAALYQFQLTGDYTASWQLESTISPNAVANGAYFSVYDVVGDFPGAVLGVVDLRFYNSALDGGLAIDDFFGFNVLVLADGAQLYTGPESNPTFLLGSFALTDFYGSGDTYNLTITDLDAPPVDVPEPASLALLMGGLGLMAASKKRRQRT